MMDNDGENNVLEPRTRLQLIIPPKIKKKNKSRKKLRKSAAMKTKGSLKNFVDLPLDIIFETISYLGPADLLNLARLSEDFRAFFMSRTSLSIWRRVLSLTGVPKCPSDLTEPQYACLMFEKFCMACGSNRGRMKTDYILRLRLCQGCRDQNLARGWTLIYEVGEMMETVLPLVPAGLSPEILEIGGTESTTGPINANPLNYFRPEVDQTFRAFQSHPIGTPGYHELVCKESARAARMAKEGFAMHGWMKTQKDQKLLDDIQLTGRRRERMLSEMKALGWEERYYPSTDIEDDEDEDEDDLSKQWYQCLFQAKEFNTRAWKRMLPKLTELYERSKQEHQVSALVNRIVDIYPTFRRRQPLEKRLALPRTTDITAIPALFEFLLDNHGQDCTDEEIEAYFETFPDHCHQYFAKIKSDLLEILRRALGPELSAALPPDALERASSLFCCSCPLCLLRGYKKNSPAVFPASGYVDHLDAVFPDPVWDDLPRTTTRGTVSAAEDILVALGLPKHSKREDVLALGPLVCDCGHHSFQGALTFDRLVAHVYREQQWYRRSMFMVPRGEHENAKKVLHDGHGPEALKQLIRLAKPDDEMTISDDDLQVNTLNTHNTDIDPSRGCRDCYHLSPYLAHVCEELGAYHIRTKHGREPVEEDFMVLPSVSSPFCYL